MTSRDPLKTDDEEKTMLAFRSSREGQRLLDLAAKTEAVSRSEFIRLAVRDRAKRILFSESE